MSPAKPKLTLVRGSTDRLRLDWDDGRATGPDGTTYFIQTARPLHEPQHSWAAIRRPGVRYDFFDDTGAQAPADCPYEEMTVREQKKVCEFDAWDRAGRPTA